MAEPLQKPRLIFEPENREEMLRAWLLHSHKCRQRYDWAARVLDKQRLCLGSTAAVLAAVVGASVFSALEQDASGWWKVVVVTISILSAILSGLSAFLNLGERADKHRAAAIQYKVVIRELERCISEGLGHAPTTPQVLQELRALKETLDKLEANTPIVPNKIFDAVDQKWDNSPALFVSKAMHMYDRRSGMTG